MIKQTQDQWLDSKYHASSYEGGLSFPDYKELANAFGLEYLEISSVKGCDANMLDMFNATKPFLCNVIIPNEARVIPQVKFGRPNEDMDPLLPRELFLHNMIIDPLDVSRYM